MPENKIYANNNMKLNYEQDYKKYLSGYDTTPNTFITVSYVLFLRREPRATGENLPPTILRYNNTYLSKEILVSEQDIAE